LQRLMKEKKRWDQLAITFGREMGGLAAIQFYDLGSTKWLNNYADKLNVCAFNRLADPSVAAELILDVGCGVGRVIPQLSMMGYTIGIDFSKEMVKLAHEKTKQMGINNVDFCVMSVNQLGFIKSFSNFVVCVYVLGYLPNNKLLEDSIREIMRVAKPNAKFLIMDNFATIPQNAPVADPRNYVFSSSNFFDILPYQGVKTIEWIGVSAKPFVDIALLLGRIDRKIPLAKPVAMILGTLLFFTSILTQKWFRNASNLRAFLFQKFNSNIVF